MRKKLTTTRLLLLGLLGLNLAVSAAKQPNILLIMADDQAKQALS